jgi:hypothetical protein
MRRESTISGKEDGSGVKKHIYTHDMGVRHSLKVYCINSCSFPGSTHSYERVCPVQVLGSDTSKF